MSSVINIISDSDSDENMADERAKVMFDRESIKQEENVVDIQDEEVSQLFGHDSTKTALKILFNGYRYETQSKPYGIRKNYFCTLKHDAVAIDSCKADGNGVYARRSNYKILCMIEYVGNEILDVHTCHAEELSDGNVPKIYYNKRVARGYEKTYVPLTNIYEVERTYRYSKWNESFVHLIITAKRYLHLRSMSHYITAYKNDKPVESFLMSRHGNASKPTAPEYHRTDKNTLMELKQDVLSGKPAAKIYEEKQDTKAANFSECIRNPKQIYNVKSQNVSVTQSECVPSSTDDLIKQIKWSNGAYMQSLTFTKDRYYHINYNKKSLSDIKRFCSEDYSVLRFDTTFEIINGFWLTDTSYSNLALIHSESGKNPEFPGPNMIHFRKDRETYRRLAGEMLMGEPELHNIKQVGTDLDPAVYEGVGDIFQNAAKRRCV